MIGSNIKRLREDKKLGLNETARRAGISAGYLSSLERGEKKNPSLDLLKKIAEVLGVSIKDLLPEKQLDNVLNNLAEAQKILESADEFKLDDSIYKIISRFENEKFNTEEQNQIVNFINYVISQRK